MKSKSGSTRAESGGESRPTPSLTVSQSIKSKLYLSFGFLIFLFLLVSLGAIGSQFYLDMLVNNIFSTQIRFVELAKTSEAGLLEVQRVERDFFASYRDRGFTVASGLLNDAENQFQIVDASLKEIQRLDIGQENIGMAREVEKSVAEYRKGLNEASAIIEKRVSDGGLEEQVRSAGRALEDFAREKGMNLADILLMRTFEQLYLMGDKKAGAQLAEELGKKRAADDAPRLPSEADQAKAVQLLAAYGTALEKIKGSDRELQEAMSKYRGINAKVRPILWDFYRVGSRDKDAAVAEMKKWARIMQYASAALLLLVIVFGIGRAIQLSKSIMGQVQHIMDICSRIGVGDYSARTEVTSNDELGAMAKSLNSMLDNIFELIQTRDERNSMQASLMKLLDDVSGIADGDLSKDAEVTQDFTGAIADAFNFAIIQLRQIVQSVKDSTFKVSSSASEISSAAEKLAAENETSARRIADATETMSDMARSARSVAETATQSAAVAEQAMDASKQGAQAVLDTIEGMNRIRDRVQETAKRIKRLGESSQEIGEIVQMINDIADRTSILAMNASIQAAMSGESGRGFAVVAEEVERLAQRSAKSTKQITELVKTIQGETNETVIAMEETTREVVAGSDLANDAGQALNQIETVSNRMAELIQSISLAAKDQAKTSDEVAGTMNELSEASGQAAAGAREAALAITSLASMADNLRDSVNVFKLPKDSKANPGD